MVTLENPQPRQRAEISWYDWVAGKLDALIPRFGLTGACGRVHRAYDLICRASLDGHPVGMTRFSRLNHDGTPIQFALSLGQQAATLQFLSDPGDPGSSHSEGREFIDATVRALFALLQLQGDLDSVLELVDSTSAASAHDMDPDGGGTFWLGAGFAPGGKSGVKIYINGKSGTEKERWSRFDNFAGFFGAIETCHSLRQLVAGKMAPLGVAVSLGRNESPTGRVYLSGYGNLVSYYEDLLRYFGDESYTDAFRKYTEVMLEEDRAYPTQSVVFSAGFGLGPGRPIDIKIEFCGHCLFPGDAQAGQRCLRWLALRNINADSYASLLEVIGGRMSATEVNTHVYLGLGWKNQQEYTTLYLKPHPPLADPSDA
ncbi:MAG: hypothetical protein WAM66_09375 [Acidobacteriaceae bacterium]